MLTMQQSSIEPSSRWRSTITRSLKPLTFAAGVLALGMAVSTPARADFAVVRYADGHCQIWWDSADHPSGAGWAKIAIGLPDATAAHITLDNALAERLCY